MQVSEYVSAGYYLSRYTGSHDCTGISLRRVTLAHDHTQRRCFPDSWTLSWCGASRAEQIARAAEFGIAPSNVDAVIEWADENFEKLFDPWSVFRELDGARTAARSMLAGAADLELWGVGLHRGLVSDFREGLERSRGIVSSGYGGSRIASGHVQPLAEGGTVLGHELLIEEHGYVFNSPESRHLDEEGALRAAGVQTNAVGLIDDLQGALACCRYLDEHSAETQHRIAGWLPWLIVRYPVF